MHRFPLFLALLILAAIPSIQLRSLEVPRWQPSDFSFKAEIAAPNPFMVDLSATVTGPGGLTFVMPGFFDGGGAWKVRVSPIAEGEWSLKTRSNHKELDGLTASFTCVANANPAVHGPLRIDKDHPRHFVHEDGTRFFLQGYEYDWLWALDTGDPGLPMVNQTLDLIRKHGFNYVILNAYAHDTKWREGTTGPDDYGPPPLYAWAGSNDQPDHSRLNLDYWRHYDQVIEALHARGMQAHVFIKVYNKRVRWPERNSPEEDLYFRWLIARYAAYPNVVWDFSKESYNEKDKEYLKGRLRFIRAQDPYHRLLTVHDDDKTYDSGGYDDLLDFHTDQAHKDIRGAILRQRARKEWPVANVETAYECGLGGIDDKTYRVAHTPEETLRQAWEVAMAGGYMAYYYTYTAWDVVRPLDQPVGYTYFKHFGDFWRSTEYWSLAPVEDEKGDAWVLANPGREYVAFRDSPGRLKLQIDAAASPLKAEWFNPHTGARIDAGTLRKGSNTLSPPAGWGNAPVVLHARAER